MREWQERLADNAGLTARKNHDFPQFIGEHSMPACVRARPPCSLPPPPTALSPRFREHGRKLGSSLMASSQSFRASGQRISLMKQAARLL